MIVTGFLINILNPKLSIFFLALVTRPRVMAWLRRVFAGGFALLGVKLAFAER